MIKPNDVLEWAKERCEKEPELYDDLDLSIEVVCEELVSRGLIQDNECLDLVERTRELLGCQN